MSAGLRSQRRTTADGRGRPAVHQFHPSTAYGDAVTNSLLLTQELLHDLGFESEIYVERADPRLAGRFRDYRKCRPGPDSLLLVHHSLGTDLVDWVLELPARKILVYHNITPPEFFPDDPYLRKYSEIGREQLLRLRSAVEGSLCISPFNAEVLVQLGYE